jgi:hypothetical protein
MDAFHWTAQTERAAQLLADGKLTLGEIAEDLDISPRTLWNWRKDPEFAARVEELLETFRQEVRRRGLAIREQRIRSLNDRWTRLQQVVEERADDPTHANVPGWKTGLLVHNVKSVGGGDNATVVDLYEVDTGLLRELREHEKQAAQELGQWVEKQETEVTAKAYVNVTPDEL